MVKLTAEGLSLLRCAEEGLPAPEGWDSDVKMHSAIDVLENQNIADWKGICAAINPMTKPAAWRIQAPFATLSLLWNSEFIGFTGD